MVFAFFFAFLFVPQSVFADGSVLIHIRYQDTIAFEGEVALPELATTTLNDSSGNSHDISSNSALYILSLVSASTSSKFSIKMGRAHV